MKINDKRNKHNELTFSELLQGEVYTDCFGAVVMKTEQNYVVALGDGALLGFICYTATDKFTPVKATLEIE